MHPLDPSDRQLRPLSEYTKRIPSRVPGKCLNRATLWRWALHGRLRTVQIGGGRFTCDAWVCEFIHGGRSDARAPITPALRAELDQITARLESPRRPIPPEERARIEAELAPPGRRRRMLTESQRARSQPEWDSDSGLVAVLGVVPQVMSR
jgi:hypothetical protein